MINDSQSLDDDSINKDMDSHRGLVNQQQDMQEFDDDSEDNLSVKSDLFDDQNMNVFGFNDDLNLDDRIIVQNAQDNQQYNMVERPKYLLQFEQKDLE